MKKHLLLLLLLALVPLAFPQSVLGHHGFGPYQTEHITALKGVVTDFEFVNPHSIVHLDVKEQDGKTDSWLVFIAPPVMLSKIGWNKNTVKPGDQITVSGYQARNGSKTLTVLKLVLPDGKVLNQAPR